MRDRLYYVLYEPFRGLYLSRHRYHHSYSKSLKKAVKLITAADVKRTINRHQRWVSQGYSTYDADATSSFEKTDSLDMEMFDILSYNETTGKTNVLLSVSMVLQKLKEVPELHV